MALTARELAEFIGAKLLGDDSVVRIRRCLPGKRRPSRSHLFGLYPPPGSRSKFGSEVCPGPVGIVAHG